MSDFDVFLIIFITIICSCIIFLNSNTKKTYLSIPIFSNVTKSFDSNCLILPKPIPQEHVNAMYNTFINFDKLFKENGICYWLGFGSAIGCLRNKPPGPLFWDDDLDVICKWSDKNRIEDILKKSMYFDHSSLPNDDTKMIKTISLQEDTDKKDLLDIFWMIDDTKQKDKYFIKTDYGDTKLLEKKHLDNCWTHFWGEKVRCSKDTLLAIYPEAFSTISCWNHSMKSIKVPIENAHPLLLRPSMPEVKKVN